MVSLFENCKIYIFCSTSFVDLYYSTIANTILQKLGDDAVVCSADDYHYNKDGDYVWNKDLLQEAHNKCQKSAEKYAVLKKPFIIIGESDYYKQYILFQEKE